MTRGALTRCGAAAILALCACGGSGSAPVLTVTTMRPPSTWQVHMKAAYSLPSRVRVLLFGEIPFESTKVTVDDSSCSQDRFSPGGDNWICTDVPSSGLDATFTFVVDYARGSGLNDLSVELQDDNGNVLGKDSDVLKLSR